MLLACLDPARARDFKHYRNCEGMATEGESSHELHSTTRARVLNVACVEVRGADGGAEQERLPGGPKIDGSAVWKEIREDKRLLELRECLYEKIGGPTRPSGVVFVLFCLMCAGLGALFLLLVSHAFGPGSFVSDATVEAITAEGTNNSTTVQCVCSAKPSGVITQLTIVMLVILSTGSASFFMYFYDQTARAVHAATIVVDGCQEVLTDREHAINELVAGQKTDLIRMQYLEKTIEGKSEREQAN